MSTDDIPPPPSSHSHPTDSLASALNESGVAPTEAAAAAAANSTSRQYYNRLDNPSTNLQGNLSLESSITFTASKKREEQNLHNQQNTAVMTSGDNQVPEGKVVESSEATRVTDTNLVDSTPKPGTVINTSTSKNPASSLLMSVLQDPQEEAMLNAHRESKVENAIEGENANSAMIYDAVQTTRGQEENQQYHHPQQRAQGPLETSCSTSAGKALPHSVSLKRPRHLITDVAHYPGHASRQVSNNNDQQAQEDASKRQKLMDASTEMHAPVLPPLASAPEFETPRESNSPANDAGASKKLNNEQWEAMYEQLKLYKQQEGHCLVPKRHGKLGTWVETQRQQYKRLPRVYDPRTGAETAVVPNKRLSADRLQKLEAIGFAWSAKKVNTSMPTGASQPMENPKAKPGGDEPLNAAIDTSKPVQPALQQPQQQARRNRLNDAQWEEMYQRLVNFRNEHGHTLVPRKYDKDPKLSTWVETQRILMNRDFRKVDPTEAVAAAAATAAATTVALADFASGNSDASADPVYESAPVMAAGGAVLQQQAADASLPSVNTNPGGAPLPAIPGAAKIAADRGKRLTPERKQKLDDIGFVWSLRTKRIEDHWDDMYKQLLAYKEEHGDTLVPSRYAPNLKLGKWVETQRYEYSKLNRANFVGGEAGGVGSEGSAKQPSTQVSNISSRPTNARLTEDRLRRLEEIGFQWKVKNKMQRYYQKQWDIMFERLKAFKEVNGHVMVAKRYPPDPRLGTWVHTQRIQHRRLIAGTKKAVLTPEEESVMKSCSDEVTYRLTEERRARLDSIGFVWNVKGDKAEVGRTTRNSYDEQWDAMFQRLQEYKAKYGNCLVPKRYNECPKLGTWVDTQRVQFKKLAKLSSQGKSPDENIAVDHDSETHGQSNGGGFGTASANGTSSAPNKPLVGRLTDERIRRLENIGFVFSLRDDWQKHYDELKAFKKTHGHCNVPARYAPNRRLGIWVSAQRQQYKAQFNQPNAMAGRRTAPLTQERISLLNELRFTWSIRTREGLGETWNQRLEELKRFKEKHGHCMVPSRYAESPELGIWVGTQRTQYRLLMKAKETGVPLPGAAAMNETRIKLLEDLGFVWTLRGSREDHMNLRQFHLQHTDDGKEEDLHLNAVKTNAPVKAP